MIAKIVAASMFVATAWVAAPATASADECLIRNGCFVTDGQWVCPNPRIYSMCRPFETGMSPSKIVFEPVKD